MNLAKILIIFLFLLTFVLPASAQDEKSKIIWKNVEAKSESFAEIKPILVNQLDKSIYLYIIYSYYNAHLQRFNEGSQKWELGGKGIGCATVPFNPIEIKPGQAKEIELAWESSTDDFEQPNFFELQDHKTLRPLIGKYKLYLSYAFEPWTLADRPKQTFSVSAEFEIVKK